MAKTLRYFTTTGTTDVDGGLAGRGFYYGARVTGDGTNPADVLVYNGATVSGGTLLDHLQCAATESFGQPFANGIRVEGLSINVTTVGTVVVWFEDET